MPLEVKKQNCEQSDGTSGSWVVVKKDSGEVESCHKSKRKASISAALREGEIDEEDVEE